MLLTLGGDLTFLAFDIDLIICSTRVCFGLPVDGVGFWRLTGGSVAFLTCSLILISSSEVVDFDEKASSLTSDSWISLNIDFSSKSDRAESVFVAVFSKICKFLTLITLLYSLM